VNEGRRKKEEGRGKKDEGRRMKEDCLLRLHTNLKITS
jgi:hypothetical protein